MSMKKNNKGFSLLELIIVIAIMAVMIGVILPQYIKYVGRSKRAVDVQNAVEFATACDLTQIYDEIGDLDPGTLAQDYLGNAYCAWNEEAADSIDTEHPQSYMDYIVRDLGSLPVSKFDNNLCWVMKFDSTTRKVAGIYLTEPSNLSAAPGPAWQQYELWPNGEDFVANGPR